MSAGIIQLIEGDKYLIEDMSFIHESIFVGFIHVDKRESIYSLGEHKFYPVFKSIEERSYIIAQPYMENNFSRLPGKDKAWIRVGLRLFNSAKTKSALIKSLNVKRKFSSKITYDNVYGKKRDEQKV